MAKSVVAAWSACVKDLQQLVATASASTPAAGAPTNTCASNEIISFKQSMNKLEEQPPLPHAAWKKLAQEVQVICWLQAPIIVI
jgi:hypothetical protein